MQLTLTTVWVINIPSLSLSPCRSLHLSSFHPYMTPGCVTDCCGAWFADDEEKGETAACHVQLRLSQLVEQSKSNTAVEKVKEA